jgi:hypothetical protein
MKRSTTIWLNSLARPNAASAETISLCEVLLLAQAIFMRNYIAVVNIDLANNGVLFYVDT